MIVEGSLARPISVEQRAEAARRRVLVVLTLAVVALGMAAFGLSFNALRDLAVASGIDESLAWSWPLVVDGFMCVATVAAVLLRPRGWRIAWYPWVTLMLAATVSVAGNALHAASHADLTRVSLVVAALVSAVPPAALLCASHMLVVLLAPPADRKDESSLSRVHENPKDEPAALHVNGDAGSSGEDEDLLARAHGEPRNGAGSAQSGGHQTMGRGMTRPTLDELQAWAAEEAGRGRRPTGAMVAERYGVSASTGRRWLRNAVSTVNAGDGARNGAL